ncbi:MAG: peptide-methionine (S)-S-oxide reductase MsrA [Nitrospiria bacterium]
MNSNSVSSSRSINNRLNIPSSRPLFKHLKHRALKAFAGLVIFTAILFGQAFADGQVSSLPDPIVDYSVAKNSTRQSAVFAGGCFWGVQAVFQHVKGVVSVTAGYAGGASKTAKYDLVSTGVTGHAESVEVVYDPEKVTYGQLLRIYFAVAHDPTQLNRQGPDTGTQYRSEIFAIDGKQKEIAEAYIRQLTAVKVFPEEIVTKVSMLPAFYPAEQYHQNFANLHPENPYIVINDLPKLNHLKAQFPRLFNPVE